MISPKLQDAINSQINKELFSEYLYLSMAAYSESENFDGIANHFHVQAQEEHFHAMKFFGYLNERGGRVKLMPIEGPQVDFKSFEEIFDLTLKHEQFVTKSINDIMDLAIKENDHATKSFLQWFIDEQVEEEASAEKLLHKVKMISGHPHGLFMLDKELAARTFTPPAAE